MKNFFVQFLTALKASIFLDNQLEVTDKLRLKTAWIIGLIMGNIGTFIVYVQLMFVNVSAYRSGQLTVIGTGNHERALITSMIIEMFSRMLQTSIFFVILILFFAFLFKLVCMKKLTYKSAQKVSLINMLLASVITTFVPGLGMGEGILILIIGLVIRSILIHKGPDRQSNPPF